MDLDNDQLGVGGEETGELVRLEAQPLRLVSLDGDGGRRYQCDFIVAGRVRRRDGRPSTWVIDPDALKEAARLFQGVAVFVDHGDWLDEGRKVHDLAGVTESDAHFWDNRIEGTIRLYIEGPGAWVNLLLDQMLDDQAHGREVPDVGLSAVFWHRSEIVDDDRITTEIVSVESVDIVFGPGAQGAVKAALQAVQDSGAEPPGGKQMGKEEQVQNAQPEEGGERAPPAAPVQQPAAVSTVPVQTVPTMPTVAPGGQFGGWSPEQAAVLQQEQQRQMNLQMASCQTFLDTQLKLLSIELPQASLDHLRKQFQNRMFAPHELQAAINDQRALLAELNAAGVVRGMGLTEGRMLNDVDQITLAYEKLMGLPVDQPVTPLTGIKELYILLTGDREMHGVYNPERVMLQNTTMAAMAEVTRNVLNKVLMAQWLALGEAGYNWWERVCHIEDFQTLQTVSWVSVDGFSDLATVAEGGTYAEITWNDDRETSSWIKKGGFVGLTLEMIDTDDVGAWKAVPRGLATAGIRTLSAAVAALFTANSGTGPALNDGYNFFDATNHLNLITQSLDPDNWDTAVQTMYAQQEQGSSKRLGIRPKFLLVPVELEKKGRQVLGSGVEPVSGVFYENVRRTAIDNCITVPDWTDEDNWAAVADPVVAPCLGVGFRFGRVPELFTVTDPRMGLMFTNDTLPIKVRYIYAVGVINYRGAVKSNH